MFYVYVLKSVKDGKLYTGFAPNLRKRLTKHNDGKVFSTKNRRPLKCIYVEICLNKEDARSREKYLKAGAGKRFLKQRLYYYF
ncbi:MAG: GIY-YIG nuclease family protein [Patescibacteria group bacterium]|mgnify:CR=1